MMLSDKNLTCRQCGAVFVFSAGEQEFFSSHGLQNEPGRCPTCRTARRASAGPGMGAAPSADREFHSAVCDGCGGEALVPFMPRGDRPVYCKDCFTKMRGQRDQR